MKLAWLTDIHLNFLDEQKRKLFYQQIVETNCDAILLTGDIAEAPTLNAILQEMAANIKKPIYFVLGNHDYYRGDIENVHQEITALMQEEPLLKWMPVTGSQLLTNEVMLVGQNGWADGRYGNYQDSRAALNDSRMIADLFQQKIIGKYALLEKMQQLADDDAEKLAADLAQAAEKNIKQIIVLTHVPPFKETSLYNGKISNDDFLPYFASKAIGDVLLSFAEQNPAIKILTLCGHTHEACVYQPLHNLIIKVGKAEYGQPEIQEVLEV